MLTALDMSGLDETIAKEENYRRARFDTSIWPLATEV
jgi:hypothetical protein